MTQKELGIAVGANQQTIEKIELGKTKQSSFLPAIANVLSLTMEEAGVRRPTIPDELRVVREPVMPTGPADFPVYAAVQGGSRGELVLTADPVQWEPRPGNLLRVPDSYGVLIVGESMVPEFEPGDIALVHPHYPPIRDVTCIFRCEAHGTHKSLIKRLVRFTSDAWHVKQWNPAKGEAHEFMLSRHQWTLCHRVVGKYSRR